MEIKSCKLTFNVSNQTVIEIVLPLILDQISAKKESKLEAKEQVQAITSTLTKFSELLSDICKGDEEDEVYLIEETEMYCASSPTLVLYFHVILQGFYKLEILQGNTILSWYDKARETVKD